MKIAPEPDHLDARVPLGLLAVSIVTLLLSALLTLVVRWSVPAAPGALPRPLAAGAPPGVPVARLFERHLPAVPTRGAPERLKGYGWVDRERGLVHIPIDRAKELYLAREGSVPQPVSPQEGWHGR